MDFFETHIGFDLETSGEMEEYALQPWRVSQGKSWVTSLAAIKLGDQHRVFGDLDPGRIQLVEFLEWAIENDYRVVGWNVTFDISWLIALGLEDLVMRVKWLDGMLLWKHATVEPEYTAKPGKKKSYRLKLCVGELWPDQAGYEEGIDFHDQSPEARAKLHQYNIRDTLYTLQASKHWWGVLTERQRRVALIEAECLPLVAAANLRGIVIDTPVARELRQHLADVAESRLELLAPLGMTEEIVRSPVKLSKMMFDDWGMEVLKTSTSKISGKTTRSTDKEVLHELSFTDPRAKTLREYREALGNRTKFAEAPLAAVEYNEDGRARPQAIVFGTYTGRLTYASKQGKNKAERQTGFALHQEKRGGLYRSIATPPEGYDLVEFDAAGQEFRWMAIASRDPTMLSLCLPGEDPHGFMASKIYHEDYRELVRLVKAGDDAADKRRKAGKVANLSLQYVTSANRLRITSRVDYNIPMTMSEAEHIHRTYRQAYREVPRYWDRQVAKVKTCGYAETLAGRRVEVIGDWSGSLGWSMKATSINYVIQGTGADQKYLAIAALKSYVRAMGALFAWELHDGLYWYVPTSRVRDFVGRAKAILDTLPYKSAWGIEPPIPLPWDAKTGPSWGQLTEWKE